MPHPVAADSIKWVIDNNLLNFFNVSPYIRVSESLWLRQNFYSCLSTSYNFMDLRDMTSPVYNNH